MGGYSVASDVSSMATTEVVNAMGRGLYPNFAKLVDDPKALATAFLHVLNSLTILCLALGCGLYAVAADFVRVVLGSQWLAAIPMLKWLAIFMALGAITHVLTSQVLIVTGHERISASLIWARVIVTLAAVIVAGKVWGVESIAAAAAASALFMLIVTIGFVTRFLPVTLDQIAQSLWRPAIASIVMIYGVHQFHLDQVSVPLVTLTMDACVGALIYSMVLLLLWVISGRPPGFERVAIDVISRLFARLRTPVSRDAI
jgi:O-antigen/teichoic acid export membrane protein